MVPPMEFIWTIYSAKNLMKTTLKKDEKFSRKTYKNSSIKQINTENEGATCQIYLNFFYGNTVLK